MRITAAPAYSIGVVAEITRSESDARIAFQDGSVYCPGAGHPNFDHLLWLAEWSRSSRPVGVVIDPAGRILDLNTAHDTGLAWLREFPTDAGRFRVAFWAYSPVCGLTREHPEFDRIYATLTAAAGGCG